MWSPRGRAAVPAVFENKQLRSLCVPLLAREEEAFLWTTFQSPKTLAVVPTEKHSPGGYGDIFNLIYSGH